MNECGLGPIKLFTKIESEPILAHRLEFVKPCPWKTSKWHFVGPIPSYTSMMSSIIIWTHCSYEFLWNILTGLLIYTIQFFGLLPIYCYPNKVAHTSRITLQNEMDCKFLKKRTITYSFCILQFIIPWLAQSGWTLNKDFPE